MSRTWKDMRPEYRRRRDPRSAERGGQLVFQLGMGTVIEVDFSAGAVSRIRARSNGRWAPLNLGRRYLGGSDAA